MSTLRVGLHVGQLFQPVPGGIGTYVRELWDALPSDAVTVQPFAAGVPSESTNAAVIDLGWPRGALRYEAWIRFRRPALPLDVEIVHGPSLAVPPARVRAGEVPLVITVHDVAFLRHPEYFTPRGVRFHERGLALAQKSAAMIVTPSEFTRTELIREGFATSRVVAIPHGITPQRTANSEPQRQTLDRFGITAPYFLIVGTIEPRKGHRLAVDAITRLRRAHPEVQLVIAGPRGWNAVAGLDQPGVTYLGAVDPNTLDALYHHAIACLVPSQYEGFGLPALEAMAHGCAVIASNTTSLPEVTGEAGLSVDPNDVNAWTDAMTQLLEQPHTREALRTAGRSRAADFRWETSARAHHQVYKQAAGRSSVTP
ncbi:MAG: glycosyltransferase family 4 protein [Acidimicrobiia bacterium]